MKHFALIALSAIALSLGLTACKSTHEEGVTSGVIKQWTDVNADAPATTKAAEDVLTEEGLKDVTSSSTQLDGKASGKMADGTKVTVMITKDPKKTMSEATVSVGTMGSPTLGANIAKKIKMKAEGR